VVKTDATGLLAGEVMIPVGDFKMPAYRAAPAGKANAPVVLVISEIFGVHEHIADVARRFAKAGYFAVAPELFVRQGDAGFLRRDRQADRRGDQQDARCAGDGRPRRLHRLGQGPGRRRRQARRHRLLLGRPHTWMYAAHNPAVKAGGGLVRPRWRAAYFPGDKSALDNVARIKAPVLGLYGAADGGIPNDTVEKMREALKAAGNTASRTGAVPRHAARLPRRLPAQLPQEQADDGWKRCLAWFKPPRLA
jgi:carboxymethylenebutenolidase